MSPDDLIVLVENKETEITVDTEVPEVDVNIDAFPDVFLKVESPLPGVSTVQVQSRMIELDVEVPKREIFLDPSPDVIVLAAGNIGPMGPAGPSGEATYIHTQSAPSAIWIITHNLNRQPSVTVVDTGDSVIEPNVRYDSPDQVTLSFGSPTSGKGYLN